LRISGLGLRTTQRREVREETRVETLAQESLEWRSIARRAQRHAADESSVAL
jgi:hypothetical protein